MLMPAEPVPLLEVKNLAISVAGRDGPVQVVHDVSLTVNRGQAVGIVGESGCGKSISMLGLVGLLPKGAKVTGGQAWFDGQDLLAMGAKGLRGLRGDRIGFVFQDASTAFNPVMRIGDQIAEPLIYKKGLTARQARTRAGELLRLVGIPGAETRIDDFPHQLSGGMRQRAMIAMGLSSGPSLLIADEPTTALDVTIQAQIVDLVKDLSAETDMAIIWITHDLALVSGIVDWINVLYAGRVVESAPVDELYARPTHPYTRGLLASLPGLEGQTGGRLPSIGGTPPDPARLPPGCAFAPRCPLAIPPCRELRPALSRAGSPHHRAACYVTARSPEEVLA